MKRQRPKQQRSPDDKLAKIEQSEEAHLLEYDFVRSEVNLLLFPFFALSSQGRAKRMETEFRAVAERDGQRAEIVWNVSANPRYGYPGLFERQVHRAVEQILSELLKANGRVENPITLGSFYGLCIRMGLIVPSQERKYGGREYKAIRRALERITTTAIRTENSFYHKGEKQWVSEIFHLYDAVVLQGRRLRDGTIADTNYLYLSDLYLQSLNALYIKPLDFRYLQSLRSHIASRLYEILGVKFYGVRNFRQAEICFRYATLSQLLPVEPSQHLSRAKQQLAAAHDELVETGFLEAYEWREARTDGHWLICYRPGKRARDEIRRAQLEQQRDESRQESQQESLPGLDERLETDPVAQLTAAEIISEEDEALIDRLVEWRVSESTAIELVESCSHDTIRLWLDAIEHSQVRDRAAFLVKAISSNWEVSEDYLRAIERQQEQEKQREAECLKQQAQQEQEKQERLRQQEAAKLDRLYEELGAEQRAQVDEEAEALLTPFIRNQIARQRRKKAPPGAVTTQMIRSKRHEMLRMWLDSGRLQE
jgi:hypothetical protein